MVEIAFHLGGGPYRVCHWINRSQFAQPRGTTGADGNADGLDHSVGFRTADVDIYANLDADCVSTAHLHCHAHPYADALGYLHRDADADVNAHLHADQYANVDAHAHCNTHADRYSHADGNAHADSDAHTHGHIHTDANSYFHTNVSHTNCEGHGDHFGDSDPHADPNPGTRRDPDNNALAH